MCAKPIHSSRTLSQHKSRGARWRDHRGDKFGVLKPAPEGGDGIRDCLSRSGGSRKPSSTRHAKSPTLTTRTSPMTVTTTPP